jgi:HAD superfamily phosphatase (TIGR01668 family)
VSLFSPDDYYTDILAVDLDGLATDGIEALIVDLDNTLLPRDSEDVPDELREWAVTVEGRGFRTCLVSNNWHERVKAVAEELGLPMVSKAVKPLPFAFLKGLKTLDARAREAAVIGDQVFTDVVGGNLIGARTVLVEPLSRSDLPHTLLLRHLEARIMAGREPAGPVSAPASDRP